MHKGVRSAVEPAKEHYIGCSEIWGGIQGEDLDVRTSGLVASLHSSAAVGAKGGDIYYISVCSNDSLTRIAIVDVTGHGDDVSHISQWLYQVLRTKMNSLEGHDVLADLNALVNKKGYKAMSTAAVVAFYRANSTLYFSYAGHPPILAYSRTDKRWEAVTLEKQEKPANLPLGAFPKVPYYQECRKAISGDRLFLYTDGVTEAPNSKRNLCTKLRSQCLKLCVNIQVVH
jgi:sigma-B regulation protein RsbU (phosphoserine phosphatase)